MWIVYRAENYTSSRLGKSERSLNNTCNTRLFHFPIWKRADILYMFTRLGLLSPRPGHTWLWQMRRKKQFPARHRAIQRPGVSHALKVSLLPSSRLQNGHWKGLSDHFDVVGGRWKKPTRLSSGFGCVCCMGNLMSLPDRGNGSCSCGGARCYHKYLEQSSTFILPIKVILKLS